MKKTPGKHHPLQLKITLPSLIGISQHMRFTSLIKSVKKDLMKDFNVEKLHSKEFLNYLKNLVTSLLRILDP